jgi:hypothetical protein
VTGSYKDDAGGDHPFSITVTFPDILGQLSVADQKAIAIEVMYRAYRINSGIDGSIT